MLPPEIVQQIYAYDPTYHEVYAKVLHQLRIKRVFWNHFYSPKARIADFFHFFGEATVNRWVFRGEEFYWEMYTMAEYEMYVAWRVYLHRSLSSSSICFKRPTTVYTSHTSVATNNPATTMA